MPLWYKDYIELKASETNEIPKKWSTHPLLKRREQICKGDLTTLSIRKDKN